MYRRNKISTELQASEILQSNTDPSSAGRPSDCLHCALRSLNHAWRKQTTKQGQMHQCEVLKLLLRNKKGNLKVLCYSEFSRKTIAKTIVLLCMCHLKNSIVSAGVYYGLFRGNLSITALDASLAIDFMFLILLQCVFSSDEYKAAMFSL